MQNKLFILISTIDERILNIKSILQPYDKNICYVISHQVTEKIDQDSISFIDMITERKDVKYSTLANKGVAKNRNNTLQFIDASSICLILDDDVTLCENTFETVIKSFEENTSADFISFKILDMHNNDYKSYPQKRQWHTLRTLTGIGTTEMAFRSDLVLNNHIKFDENFGPGSSSYPIGEDFIFAMDLHKLKTKMLFLPVPIVKHPRESTGGSLDKKVIFGRGAMFARVFGWKAFIVNILFSIKKYTVYRKRISLLSYLTLMTQGTIDYFVSVRKKGS